MNDAIKKDPQFHKVHITVIPNQAGGYDVTYEPKIVKPTVNDTVISCMLVAPTPKDIKILSVQVNPEPNDQMSTATISKNGKMATVIDVNSELGTFHLDITYGSDETGAAIPVSAANVAAAMYPEVDNEPPR